MFGEVRLTELLTINKTCIRYMSLTSISLVLVSTVGMCLNTMQTFRYYDANKEPMDNPYLALIEVPRPTAQWQCLTILCAGCLYLLVHCGVPPPLGRSTGQGMCNTVLLSEY